MLTYIQNKNQELHDRSLCEEADFQDVRANRSAQRKPTKTWIAKPRLHTTAGCLDIYPTHQDLSIKKTMHINFADEERFIQKFLLILMYPYIAMGWW